MHGVMMKKRGIKFCKNINNSFKKVVVLLETEPKWGGEHQYALTLMRCLDKRDDNLELAAICGNRYWERWCRERRIRILDVPWPVLKMKEQRLHIRHPLFSRIYMMYITELGKWLRSEKVDAVLCTAQRTFIPNIGTKIIAPVHDLMHRYEGRFPEVKEDYESRELLFASKAKYAWCVLTDSKLGKKQFMESYSEYMGENTPHVVSLPYVISAHITECAEEYIDTPTKYVFYPAQFWQHKNHMNLIKAVHLLAGDIPDIHLILVGSEKNSMERIREYIFRHGLGGNITIKGFVSDGNITYLYRHAVAMIMPSYFGPTNIPPLEAMALGCPVAVSNKYAMPEQVGDAGLLFNPDSPEEIADCIRKLWTDAKLREEMIIKGYRRIQTWTEEDFMNRVLKAVDKCCENI